MINRNSILARLEVVADALSLSDSDLKGMARNDGRLIEFAAEHNISLDWLVLGDVRSYIRQASRDANAL